MTICLVIIGSQPLPLGKSKKQWNLATRLIKISGDCHPNPGPNIKFPCGVCRKPCKSNQRAVACDTCDTWFHTSCMGMPNTVYKGLTSNVSWICCSCGLPNFSSTLFTTVSADSVHTSIATENTYSILSYTTRSPDTCHTTTSFHSEGSSIGSAQPGCTLSRVFHGNPWKI